MDGRDASDRRDAPDTLDELFARLPQPTPPPDFLASVLASTVRQAPQLSWKVAVLNAVSVLVLAWAAFDVGRTLAFGAMETLLDFEFISLAPIEWLAAVGEMAPLLSLAALAAAASAVALSTHSMLRAQSSRLVA